MGRGIMASIWNYLQYRSGRSFFASLLRLCLGLRWVLNVHASENEQGCAPMRSYVLGPHSLLLLRGWFRSSMRIPLCSTRCASLPRSSLVSGFWVQGSFMFSVRFLPDLRQRQVFGELREAA